jgi:hypothetical protein
MTMIFYLVRIYFAARELPHLLLIIQPIKCPLLIFSRQYPERCKKRVTGKDSVFMQDAPWWFCYFISEFSTAYLISMAVFFKLSFRKMFLRCVLTVVLLIVK